jgi:hypothetical protein
MSIFERDLNLPPLNSIKAKFFLGCSLMMQDQKKEKGKEVKKKTLVLIS